MVGELMSKDRRLRRVAVGAGLIVGLVAVGADPAVITAVGRQKGWLPEAPTAATWRPLAQPGLEQAVKAAPVLVLTAVAPPPRRCWVGHQPYLVPNPDGASWDAIYPYFNKYRAEQEVVIHDFGTGKTSHQRLATGKGDSVLTRESIGFHMQPSYYTGGRLVFEHYGAVMFTVYDPAVDRFVQGVKPFGDVVINGRCVLGADGAIYGMGWPRDKSGFVAYRFDPQTGEAEASEVFGPPNRSRRELYRSVVMSGDWLYAAVGSRPWHVVAYNFKTREGRLLATTAKILGGPKTVSMGHVPGGLRGAINEAAFIDGIDEFDHETFAFWLHDGRILRRVGEEPPWSTAAVVVHRQKRFRWAREFQAWPADFTPPSPPPQFEADSGKPAPGGRVQLRYRFPDDSDWRVLEYSVKMYPGELLMLTEVNDHTLFATDSGYGQQVFYDLRADPINVTRVGGTVSPYSAGLMDGKLYVSGYPSAQMYVYDFSLPLGLKQAEPNPRRLGYIGKEMSTHCPLAGTVGAADGRVYCAGTTYGRRRVGGGLGWFDTKRNSIGGIAIDDHRVFWMSSAAAGRYVLLSTKAAGGGKLFCWDTQAHAFTYKKAVLDSATPGPVEEALPGGLVLGHTYTTAAGGLLYGVDAETGRVLWQQPVPAGPLTAFSQVRRLRYSFRRGPLGYVWTFFGDVLVRIDPRDAAVKVLGRVATGPAQLAFAGGDVYLGGGTRLRRFETVTTTE
jgi:outer membrane protein assembly factor BamB